jgi:hypothetical protein
VALDIEDDVVWPVMAPRVIVSERTPLRRMLPRGAEILFRV